MAKRKKQRSTYFPTKIPIASLSGGVGRQAPNKRLPSEAENLDNVFCTTERSIDKRNGFEICSGDSTLDIESSDNFRGFWWYWYNAGSQRRYLIGIDTNAQEKKDLLHVYRVQDNEVFKQITDQEIDQDIFNYLTFGTKTTKDRMRACSVGSSVLVLNTEVKAGFTSDGTLEDVIGGDGVATTESLRFNLDGTKGTAFDLVGPELDYETAVSVDKDGLAEVWTEYSNYVWGQTAIDTNDNKGQFGGNEADPDGRDSLRFGIWRVKQDIVDSALPGPANADDGTGDDPVGPVKRPSEDLNRWERVPSDVAGGANEDQYKWTEFISPDDYVYPDPLKLNLGQAVSRLSSLKFPLPLTDLTTNNGDDDKVGRSFIELYPNSGDASGNGKIFFLSQAYLASTPGFYRAISSEKAPYLEKIRTPDAMSVIDNKRMPMQIFLDEENNQWSIRKVDWNPRTSGTGKSNPGPSFFKTKKGEAKQVEIKAVSFYRDRLFLATEDALVSSELGDFSNFFLKDPSNIVFTDPIDLSVSSNVFTPITFLKPFKDFLFLGTSGDTQYELIGSENQISPLTAEIAPTSFFPMTEDVEPLVMNNNLFFFSKKRLFIYFQRFEAAGQQAFELSRHVPDYLPNRFWATAVSTSHNTIFAVEGEEPSNKLFCYRNQVQGEQIVQNAFFTMTLPNQNKIQTITAVEDEVFIVVSDTNSSRGDILQVQRMSLIPEELDLPRIDSRVSRTIFDTARDSEQNTTTIILNGATGISNATDIIVFNDGSSYDCTPATINVDGNNYDAVKINGSAIASGSCYVGKKFKTTVELSTLFVRDDRNNIVPGTLNLRYCVVRHRNTGTYDVAVSRKGRAAETYTFNYETGGEYTTVLDSKLFEEDGTFKFPLMGFTDDIKIEITSSFPNPMNLTHIEVAGKFKRVPKFLTT